MNGEAVKRLIRPEIMALPTYHAGISLERIRAETGLERIVKLDSNENPLPASPAVRDALARLHDEVFRYPDREELRLRAVIGEAIDVAPDRLAFSAGSEDLTAMVLRIVLRPGDRLLTACPAFILYEICAAMAGADLVRIPFHDNWSFPVDGLRAELGERPRVLVVNSPSNPTGVALSPDGFAAMLAEVDEETLVILDEAYVEYVTDDRRGPLLPLLRTHRGPWVVLRTFSKIYGLAGLRLGYGIFSDRHLAEAVYKIRSPFNVNAAALAAAEAAYGDRAHVKRTRSTMARERARVAAALTGLGWPPAPSVANFLFVDCGRPAVEVAAALRSRGVLIKPWLENGYERFARVTIGLPKENDAFLETFAAVTSTQGRSTV
jgi:histidinol-phosphate aminotransferase